MSNKRLFSRLLLYVHVLLSLPKTIYMNYRCFPLVTAIRLPILISFKIRIIELHRGVICLPENYSTFMIKFGFGGSIGIHENKGYISLEKGVVRFKGRASFSEGVSLRNSGELVFGMNFWSNKNSTLWCSNKILIGNNVLLGWNVLMRDSDGHAIIINEVRHNADGIISIGDHCWICSEAHILKNSGLGNDCILGYRSLLTKQFNENNCLYVGIPASLKKKHIIWSRET